MQIFPTSELERLVRETFPGKLEVSAEAELGADLHRRPIVMFVHGGPDPFLDRAFESWLYGAPAFVAAHQLVNPLCRAGALALGGIRTHATALLNRRSGRRARPTCPCQLAR